MAPRFFVNTLAQIFVGPRDNSRQDSLAIFNALVYVMISELVKWFCLAVSWTWLIPIKIQTLIVTTKIGVGARRSQVPWNRD